MKRFASVLVPLLLLGLAATPAARAADEARIDVHFMNLSQPGWQMAAGYDINDAGRVVGISEDGGGNFRGFLKAGKTYTTVHPPGWESSSANRIAPNGLVIGDGRDGASVTMAFLYDGSTYTPLLPPGWPGAYGNAVNSSGQAVGSESGIGATRAFLYSGGAFTILAAPGATRTQAYDINEAGMVVGRGSTGGIDEAFLYSGGVYSNPAPAGWTDTDAGRINGRGDILGSGNDGVNDLFWLKSGGVHTVIQPPGMVNYFCSDLTESGAVIGIGITAMLEIKMFVYRDGEYYFYDDDPVNYFLPQGINSSWQMVGTRAGGSGHVAYILPTPLLTANGKKGSVGISAAAALRIGTSLKSWWGKGRGADWWLVAQTPTGTYSFDIASRSWKPGFSPSVTQPLGDLAPRNLPGAGNVPGVYTYYFGVDLKPNGVLDFSWWLFDRVTVFVR